MNDDKFSDLKIANILSSVKTIAVVGLSPNPSRPSNYVSKYMFENGYDIVPVNPGHNTIFWFTLLFFFKRNPI